MAHTYDNKRIIKQEMRHMMEHAEALMDATAGELDERVTKARTRLKDRMDSAKGVFDTLETKVVD
jgi:ElaB/YqjD/DUF883 family membrane-anchored ribosome-binding protein